VFYCFNLLLCSHFNFLHLMKCQDGIGSCKMPLLQIDRMVGALIYIYIYIYIYMCVCVCVCVCVHTREKGREFKLLTFVLLGVVHSPRVTQPWLTTTNVRTIHVD
jgi:hypothetical protein